MPHQIFYDILDSLDLTIIYIIDKFCVVCLTCESFHSNDTDNFLNLFPLLTSVNLKVQMYKAYKNKGMCMCGWLVDYTLCNSSHYHLIRFLKLCNKRNRRSFLRNHSTSYKKHIWNWERIFFFFKLVAKTSSICVSCTLGALTEQCYVSVWAHTPPLFPWQHSITEKQQFILILVEDVPSIDFQL